MMKIAQFAALPIAVVAIQVNDNKNTAKKGLKKAIAAGMVAAIPAVTGQSTATPVPMPTQCGSSTHFGGLSQCNPYLHATQIADLWCQKSFGERSRAVSFNNVGGRDSQAGYPVACKFDVAWATPPTSHLFWPDIVRDANATNGFKDPTQQWGYDCAADRADLSGCKCFEAGNILCQTPGQ